MAETKSWQMPARVDRLLDIGVAPEDSSELMRTKRLYTGVLWISLPLSTVSLLQLALVQGVPMAALMLVPMSLLVIGSLLVIWRWPASFPNLYHVMVGMALAMAAGLVVLAGGVVASGANSLWAFLAVLFAVVLFTDWRATMWFWIFLVSQAIAIAWSQQVEPVLVMANAELIVVFNLLAVSVLTYFIVLYYARQRASLLSESDDLLLNILPADIAERLKTSSDTIAEDYESASVLFADVVDFTPVSAMLEPTELVGLLDEVFSAIDALVEERGLEKIKTIGDAYMVAAGVPHPRDDHAAVLCDLALEITAMTSRRRFNGHQIRFRVGINSGPVVAGIIGTKKFSYDLWGDTVNVASRMESSATDGAIRITEATQVLVNDEFSCQALGVAEIKGRGPMQVFQLTGHR
ncbi:MAG: adenylate/guanylate cyclase domain-containing protein [Acidimicrobiia bacterium]